MPADTLLGDCQPIVMAAAGTGVMKPAGEKIETYLRAYFHDKAVKNGYPVALAEKMVSVDMEAVEIRFVHEDKLLEEVDFANRAVFDLLWSERMRAFISRKEFEGWAERDRAHFEIVGVAVPQGQLLTMNERQARQNRFALPDVVSWEEMLQAFNISRVQAVGTTFWERTLDFLNWISPVVVSLGAILLFIELVTPGFGLVGSLGIFSFAIFFLTKALIGYADYADIVLFFAGLILLVVEVFLLPGFIVFGLVGLLAVAASILLASQRFAVPETAVEWTIFKQNLLEYGLAFVAAVVVMAILARFLPGSPLLRRLALQPPAPRGPDISGGGTLEETEPGLVGLLGRALTDLRPAGKLDLNGRRLDVTADGEYVRAGDTARVMRLEGNRVYVRREAAASLADDEAGPPPI
ncbi:MAG: hypothetical protein HY719_15995 [Planctomycetes bacterium]|nr:hypothetical protein [Planctomycetota bacterium]